MALTMQEKRRVGREVALRYSHTLERSGTTLPDPLRAALLHMGSAPMDRLLRAEKVRTDSRVQKRYRPPLTPLHRLLQAPRSVIRQRHASCASSGTRVPSLCSGTSTYCRHGSSGRQARIPPSEP
jgi:hypothetical protein